MRGRSMRGRFPSRKRTVSNFFLGQATANAGWMSIPSPEQSNSRPCFRDVRRVVAYHGIREGPGRGLLAFFRKGPALVPGWASGYHPVGSSSVAFISCAPFHPFHCVSLHFIAFHCISLHFIAFHCISFHRCVFVSGRGVAEMKCNETLSPAIWCLAPDSRWEWGLAGRREQSPCATLSDRIRTWPDLLGSALGGTVRHRQVMGRISSSQGRSGALTPWQIGKMAKRSKGKAQREAGFPVTARDYSATEKANWQNSQGRWRNGQNLTSYLELSSR